MERCSWSRKGEEGSKAKIRSTEINVNSVGVFMCPGKKTLCVYAQVDEYEAIQVSGLLLFFITPETTLGPSQHLLAFQKQQQRHFQPCGSELERFCEVLLPPGSALRAEGHTCPLPGHSSVWENLC